MSKWKQNNQQANWKWPLLLGIIALLTLMFVIPTIIVIPFKSDQMIQASIETVNNDTPAKEEIAALESPFDVGVLRTAKNEVEQIPLEEYVAHVIASEMPADFEMEALKAQALAARTFIIKFLMQENTDKLPGDADVKDTVEHQVYKSTDELRQIWGGSDYHWKMDKIMGAVTATQGQIITYSNEPITASFFSTSNGYTENSEDYWEGELPYLRSVKSPWDEEVSPKFIDQKIFTRAELEAKLNIDLSNQIGDFQLTRTEGQRVATATIGGGNIYWT